MRKLNLLTLLFQICFSQIDYEWNPCWTLPFKNESYFCNEAVTWKISEHTYENSWEKDKLARKDYESLLDRYRE